MENFQFFTDEQKDFKEIFNQLSSKSQRDDSFTWAWVIGFFWSYITIMIPTVITMVLDNFIIKNWALEETLSFSSVPPVIVLLIIIMGFPLVFSFPVAFYIRKRGRKQHQKDLEWFQKIYTDGTFDKLRKAIDERVDFLQKIRLSSEDSEEHQLVNQIFDTSSKWQEILGMMKRYTEAMSRSLHLLKEHNIITSA